MLDYPGVISVNTGALKNRRGPFSVVEILKEVFNEDFFAAIDRFGRSTPKY